MKPVDQTIVDRPDDDCFAVCLASVFEINIGDLPQPGKDDNWCTPYREWLLDRGYGMLAVKVDPQFWPELSGSFLIAG